MAFYTALIYVWEDEECCLWPKRLDGTLNILHWSVSLKESLRVGTKESTPRLTSMQKV